MRTRHSAPTEGELYDRGTTFAAHSLMLRIQRSLNGDAVTIELIGRVLDHDLSQLEALIQAEKRGFALNLRQVTIAERGAVPFLARRPTAGVRLEDAQVYLDDWLSEERDQA